jgi:hypothetical protein
VTRSPAPTGSPWTPNDLLVTTGLVSVGVAFAVLGWSLASARAAVTDQVGLASLALVGVALAFVGQAVWLLRGRRAVGDRINHLLGPPPAAPANTTVGVREQSNELVAATGLRLYHRRTCLLVPAAGCRKAARSAHEKAGRRPCGVCRP